MRYLLLLVILLGGCAGKGKIEYWLRDTETKELVHEATICTEGKVSGEIDLKNQTAKIDSKQPSFLDGAIKNIKIEND